MFDKLTSIGRDHREFVRAASLIIQFSDNAHFTGTVPHLKVDGQCLEAIAQSVIDHCIDAAVWIAGRYLFYFLEELNRMFRIFWLRFH